MVGQEMQVRWRQHQSGLLTYLRQMLTTELFVDVTLCCQNKRLKAHKVLLSACSPYLQDLLTAHPTSDHTTIILDDIAYEDMRSLLDFVYTGGVTVSEERLPSFLEAAQILQITVLTNKSLHQQLPTKTLPPLIKVHQDRAFPFQNCRQVYKDPAAFVVKPNGYKTEFDPPLQEPMDHDQLKPHINEPILSTESTVRNVKTEQTLPVNEQDLASETGSKDSRVLGSPTTEYKPYIHSPCHMSPIPRAEHNQNSVNRFETSSSGSSPSPDTMDFQWVRPLPSLMPISASAVLAQRTQKHPRKLGGILTPSPWAQNGRPQVGAPRVMRSPSRCVERNSQHEEDHLDGRLGTPPNCHPLESNGTALGSPRLLDTSSRSDGDSSSEPPSSLRENDENRPDVIKLCRLKERRLQEFYREQMLSNGTPLTLPPEDTSDLSFKTPLLLDKIQRYSEQPFNFPNKLHHISRILGADNGTGYQVDMNPLHGLKTLASLLEDSSNSSCSTGIQRRKSRSCSDLTEEPSRNDSNNNEGSEAADVHRCVDCGKTCGTLQQLLQHQQSPECLSCGVCGKQFSQRSQWSAHQKLHEEARPEHACTHCNKTFVTRASLKVHLRTHTGEKPFHCLECGKQFSQLRNYKYHRSVHEGTREFAATCPECGKYFNDRGYLSSHMKIHRNRKEYGCEYCGKSFNQRVAYNMHVRIHTGEKPHVCQHCNKCFSRKMLLKQHLRIHTGEKPFTCVVCQKAFADRSNMTLHMRLHSGVKPYTCNVCNKAFTKKHHLKTHMNYHTGVKPYACSKCGLRFSQSSNMRTHFKKCSSTAFTDLPTPPTSVTSPLPLNMAVTPPASDESSCTGSIIKSNA